MLSEKVPYFIIDLLQQVPSVFVAGLGRFDAIFHSAVIDTLQSQVKPPYVEPDFKKSEESADSLLPAYMHYVIGAEHDAAEKAIEEFVHQVHVNTEDGKTFAIEKFGTFSKSYSGGIRFTPDWDAFNLSFSGLEVLDLKIPATVTQKSIPYSPPVATTFETVRRPTYEPVIEQKEILPVSPEPKQEEAAMESDEVDQTTSRMWWMILSSALILIAILCAYLAWDIVSNRNKLNELKQIYPDTGAIQPIDLQEPVDTPPQPVDEVPAESGTEQQKPTPETGSAEETAQPCFVVVGAFANPDNTTRMVERLQSMGYIAEQIKGGSLTKVAIRTSCEAANLQKVLDEARSSINPESWIY